MLIVLRNYFISKEFNFTFCWYSNHKINAF